MVRWLMPGLLVFLLAAGCGRKAGAPAALPPASSVQPSARGLPTPPLDPGHLAPPRTVSAGDIPFDTAAVYAYSDNGETGDKGGGTFAVLPGGEDDLNSAWVIFRIQLAADDRPVSFDLQSTFATVPGGEDDLVLSFWLAAYSFSQARWDWLEPPPASADPLRPGAWQAQGSTPVTVNSEELRQRYCNLGGEVYLCVLVEPKSRTGAWCGVLLQPGTLAISNKDGAGYFRTEPLPAKITSATGDSGSAQVTVDISEGEPGEADRIYIIRRDASGMSAARAASTAGSGGWMELGYLDRGQTIFIDPADTINPAAAAPGTGKSYEYYAVGAVLEGNRALRSTRSNSGTCSVDPVWSEVALATSMQINQISLAVINGQPAVTYTDHSQGVCHVYYQRASTVEGANPADWSAPIELDVSTSNSDGYAELLEVNGTPAVCYTDYGDFTLRYKRSTTPAGTTSGDWPALHVSISFPGTEKASYGHSLAVIAGHPAVAYQDTNFVTDSGIYVRSTTAGGDSTGDWAVHTVLAGTQSFSQPSLAEINGVPAIAYYQSTGAVAQQSLQYIYSTTATGDQPSDWAAPVELLTGGGSYWPTLLLVDGFPTIIYSRFTPKELGVIRSTSAQGALAADWTQQFVFPTAVEWSSAANPVAVVAGRPVIVTPSVQYDLLLFRSTTADGSDIGEWSAPQDTGLNGDYVTVIEVNGKVALAYMDRTTFAPKYAILQ